MMIPKKTKGRYRTLRSRDASELLLLPVDRDIESLRMVSQGLMDRIRVGGMLRYTSIQEP